MSVWTDSNNMGERRDCGVISLALACDVSYAEAHAALKASGRRGRCGTYDYQMTQGARRLGFELVKEVVRQPGGGKYTMRTVGKALLKSRRYIAHVHDHYAAIVDGQVKDRTAGGLERVKWVWWAVPNPALRIES